MTTASRKSNMALLWTALALFGLCANCENNTGSILILQNQVPGEGCVVDSAEGSAYRTQGTLDLSAFLDMDMAPTGYAMYPLVKNNMISTEDTQAGVVEQNCVVLDHVKVDLDLGGLGEFVESSFTKYKVGISGTICPGQVRAIAVTVVLPQVVQVISGQIGENQVEFAEAAIRVVAKRGSQSIESAPMNFPIFLCRGCLITNYGACDSPNLPETPASGNPCNFAQDDRVDCCQEGSLYVCPASAPTTEETP